MCVCDELLRQQAQQATHAMHSKRGKHYNFGISFTNNNTMDWEWNRRRRKKVKTGNFIKIRSRTKISVGFIMAATHKCHILHAFMRKRSDIFFHLIFFCTKSFIFVCRTQTFLLYIFGEQLKDYSFFWCETGDLRRATVRGFVYI